MFAFWEWFTSYKLHVLPKPNQPCNWPPCNHLKKNNSLLFKLSKCQKVAGLSLTIYNLKHQCNSSLYLYHNKLVGFVLQDKEHTMLLTLVPELGCLRLRDERTTSKFSVLDLINFLLFYFQPNFSSQVYFN